MAVGNETLGSLDSKRCLIGTREIRAGSSKRGTSIHWVECFSFAACAEVETPVVDGSSMRNTVYKRLTLVLE